MRALFVITLALSTALTALAGPISDLPAPGKYEISTGGIDVGTMTVTSGLTIGWDVDGDTIDDVAYTYDPSKGAFKGGGKCLFWDRIGPGKYKLTWTSKSAPAQLGIANMVPSTP